MLFTVTQDLRVSVESEYIPEQSNPERDYYFFAYHITLKNEGEQTVQLLSRHWIITNAHGRMEEVKGEGVVGEQPVLGPGESFSYTSFCPLSTPSGTMEGSYQMVTQEGASFDAAIPQFKLFLKEIMWN